MPRWLPRVIERIHQLAAEDRYRLTYKAEGEAASLGLAPQDVRELLVRLGRSDADHRLVSKRTGEWMYIFKPQVCGQVLYVKLVLREACVVLSFHEDRGGDHEEGE